MGLMLLKSSFQFACKLDKHLDKNVSRKLSCLTVAITDLLHGRY